MAAVLCDCMKNVAQILAFVLTCPCRACGDSCDSVGRSLASPFTPYLVTTLGLNIPAIVWGILALLAIKDPGNNTGRCRPLDRWLWVNAGLSILHIWGSFYISSRVQDERVKQQQRHEDAADTDTDSEGSEEDVWKGIPPPTISKTEYRKMKDTESQKQQEPPPNKPTTLGDKVLYTMSSAASIPAIGGSETWKERASREVVLGDGNDDGEANSLQRLRHVFCYDAIVATYMVCALFWCAWQSYGISQVLLLESHANSGNEADLSNDLCDKIEYWTILSILCNFLYMMLVCVAFSCSLLCMRY